MAQGKIEQTSDGFRATVASIVVEHKTETVAKNTAATRAHKAGLIQGEEVDWGDDYPSRYVAPTVMQSGGFDTPIKGTRRPPRAA